ncbi:MAG: bifunctional diguanylate cyclase/phosphodiesterase [Clostridia bacterium]|nr:bifunctional diguanylate cyclase/phosphodiesterase [Clostridia bacterium]
MKEAFRFISHIFGFEKLSKNEKDYLHDANIRSSSYMGVIVVVLEIWMLIRQAHSKIIPKYQAGGDLLQLIINYTTKYWLFLFIGLGITLFCFFQKDKKLSKGRFRALLAIGSVCILYTSVISLEKFTKESDTITPVMAGIMNAMLISIYVLLFLIGVTITTYALFKYRKNKTIILLEHLAIIEFTLICLAFGIFVSYSDFWGGKEIICFLTMVIYVGCLLIYRPFVTVLILGASFWGFYRVLLTYQSGLSFQDQEVMISGAVQKIISGDTVNYITFLISLSTICFAIYHGRLNEAKKSTALEKSAREDALTGMCNYSYFSELAKERIQSITDHFNENVFLFLDVYNFKAFNDQRGFEAGDKFIIAIGQSISDLFNDSLCARQADDHFVVLTKNTNLMERLTALNNLVHDYDDEILLGINCGAYHLSNNAEDPRMAIDRARYAAHLIKNRFQTICAEYDKTMSEAYHKRLYVVNNIDNAVNNGWIIPFYQPVVWSDSEELCGCEALARWRDPVYGQLFPNEFIPVLEEYRLIHKLDKAIFESVCKDIRAAMDAGKPVVPVSLNFSRLDFELMDAVQELEDLVAKYAIPKDMIHVEVTESALTDNFVKLNAAMNRIKELGYSLWLDDFGSGYSSLNVLKDYQFDVIKIDMRFLSNLENSEKSKTLLDCIVKMANRIHMLTLTEGVETKTQAEFLNKIGCTRLQGYLFGKPIPKDELYKRIDKNELRVSGRHL